MPLRLIVGPANAGKVALLLDRYLAAAGQDPYLIVPTRADVVRVERDLVARASALFGGWLGTFDDLFELLARPAAGARPLLGEAQRALALRRAVAQVRLQGLSRSARFTGFADALGQALAEVGAAVLVGKSLDGELAELQRAYAGELDRLGRWDREALRRCAAERVASDLGAWNGAPVFAYGFEDLTAAEWALLEALAARADVTVSLPYEPARPAFAALERTAADLSALAGGRIEELPPANALFAEPAIAHVERGLFAGRPPAGAPPLDGAVRFLEGAGARGTLELVGDEILALVRAGTAAERIGVVLPSLERFRAPLDTAFSTLGIPYGLEGELRLGQTPFGHALLSLLRFAWLQGGRRDLYAFLRSPYSGLARAHVDFLEGRLRGRAVEERERVEQVTLELRGQPIPPLEALRAAPGALAGLSGLVLGMVRAAHGLDQPPTAEGARLDLRAFEAVRRLVAELEEWEALTGGTLSHEETVGALERTSLWLAEADEPGRVAVLDLGRARTRHFEAVFLLGLEEGSLPRRVQASPFLDEEARRGLPDAARLVRADPASRDRYLFYTACARASRRLTLVREAANDEGGPRQAGPFWEEVRALFPEQEVARWTRRRPLGELVWPLETAPTERERLRALAALHPLTPGEAAAFALANGWERKVARARAAFERRTALTHAAVLSGFAARSTFGVTELEKFIDCSSMWLFERVVAPRTIDAEVDPMLRGSVAHQTLYRFYSGLPKRLGTDQVQAERLGDALEFLRECLEGAIRGQVKLDLTNVQRQELQQSLWRDLEQLVRAEAASPLPLVPRRFEVSFGTDRTSPELQRGLELGGFSVSGKIDRIDVDPFSARGIVQDYKSGATAQSAADIAREGKLQIPLYMLVLRDLIGIEPLGGVYRALSGERKARGMLRAEAREDGVPGYTATDYLDEEEFWGQVETAAQLARGAVERMRAGDVRHDPHSGECPSWCDLWTMCRVRRP